MCFINRFDLAHLINGYLIICWIFVYQKHVYIDIAAHILDDAVIILIIWENPHNVMCHVVFHDKHHGVYMMAICPFLTTA